ncbi:MAG: uracil-DNA glycosylase [Planctomycetota bacterium]|jgi:DNA polymerase
MGIIEDPMLERAARAMVETDLLLGAPLTPLARTRVEEILPSAEEDAVRPVDRVEEASTRASDPAASGTAGHSNPPSAIGVGIPAVSRDDLLGGSVAEKLSDLAARHAAECVHCNASGTHLNIVFGEGDEAASLMFVGEAPGEREDRTGRPFVGPAGEKLDQMIDAMGFSRETVYITNVLKTRPPENRTPRPDEAEACGRWLASQIELIRPRAIVALGGPAAKLLLGAETGITRLRGVWGRYDVGDLEIPVMPTFHPAYVLRQYTAEVRAAVWNDLQLARDLVRSSEA